MKLLKDTKDYYIIKKSGLFDKEWFKNNYDLSDSVNPIKYYLRYGIEKGLNPSIDFDTLWYLNEYEDVRNSGMHPFVHYIRHGIGEHRLSKPLFVKNNDKFSLINQDYNPCFLKNNLENIDENEVNVAIFMKNDIENLLPTEYVRLVIPFYHLFLEKNFKPYVCGSIDLNKEYFRNIDVAIVQRDALDKNSARLLVEICRANKIKLIYEIDDDLLGIDESHPSYVEFFDKNEVIKYLISNSDVFTVSTEHLKEKLISLNYNSKVIKNSSNDMFCLKNNSLNSDVIKIGYMGTLTHKNDVKIVEKAIENVKKYFSKKGKKVIFETVGVSDEKIGCANPINIPFKYSKYPYFIRWLKRIIDWDIALAPLENTDVNNSKSEIKYLEYSSLGIAGIYSDIGAYSEVIENNENGILIENNSSEEWESAIIELIDNVELRKSIVKNANIDLQKNYSIDIMVNLWNEIFEEVLTKEKLNIFNKNSLKLLVNPLFNEDYKIIVESGLFNKEEYPIITKDPIYHFLSNGVFEGYRPYNEFNVQEYVELFNIDIKETNPLSHFIKRFIYKFKYNYLSSENIEDILKNLENKISIIVPIYNAYEETKKCIESIFKYSNTNFELILINDKSTDKRIYELFNVYEGNSNVKIIHNDVNVGFVSSANIGLKNSDYDVILLNSDTIVTPKWIQKLIIAAYSDKKIATVTPFSNNAGVFSVPFGNKENVIPEDLGINGVSNIVEKSSNHVYLRVPTGNGFCMYIKREAINSVGYFDEKTFGRGYGEENDFCMRAIENGWVNIIDDSTYIFHRNSSSFGEEKHYLIEKNINSLIKRHPKYFIEVNNFINSCEYSNMRCIVFNALKNKKLNKKNALYVTKSEKYLKFNVTEFVLYIGEQFELYYFEDSLFKIKEGPLKDIDEICFNILINLCIDKMIIENESIDLRNSKKLMNFFNEI